MPHFNGPVTVIAMKETKRRFFLTSAKESTTKSNLKDIHILGP